MTEPPHFAACRRRTPEEAAYLRDREMYPEDYESPEDEE